MGTGFDINGVVYDITIQNDGNILVGGNFIEYNGNACRSLVRLNSDGTFDNTFSTGTGFNNIVNTISIQSNGKIFAGGKFTQYNGNTSKGIARLNANGSLDNTFNTGTGFNGDVSTLTLQNDGKILAGGWFGGYNNNVSYHIARLNTDGSFDNTFNVGATFWGYIKTISVQRDGKIFIGGGFIDSNGKGGIARLHSNGTIDSTFNIWVNNRNNIYTSHLQSNGKLLVGGEFMIYGELARNHIARFNVSCSTMNIAGPNLNTLPNATIGVAYSQNFTQTGSNSTVTWSATGLPDGLSIDPNTGTLSGTPTTVGTNTITIIVTDTNGNRVSQVYILIVENDSILAIGDDKIELVKLYPNPTSNKIKVETKNQIIDFQIYNSLGQKQKSIWKNIEEEVEIDLSQLPTGIYYLHINTTSGIVIRCLNKL